MNEAVLKVLTGAGSNPLTNALLRVINLNLGVNTTETELSPKVWMDRLRHEQMRAIHYSLIEEPLSKENDNGIF